MFKVNKRNIRTRCKICSQLSIKTLERHHWHHSSVFIVNFKHISHLVLGFLLLTLSRYMPAGLCFNCCITAFNFYFRTLILILSSISNQFSRISYCNKKFANWFPLKDSFAKYSATRRNLSILQNVLLLLRKPLFYCWILDETCE